MGIGILTAPVEDTYSRGPYLMRIKDVHDSGIHNKGRERCGTVTVHEGDRRIRNIEYLLRYEPRTTDHANHKAPRIGKPPGQFSFLRRIL